MASVGATLIYNYQNKVLDVAYNSITDGSVVNAHYVNVPPTANQMVRPSDHNPHENTNNNIYSGHLSLMEVEQ